MGADIVAIAGVVDHDEQHCLLAHVLVFGVALLPFLDAERQVVGELLVEHGARLLVQALAAGCIGQHRVLDDALVDRLDERVVADRLHEDRPVVVARRRRHVDLQGKAAVLLQHAVVDVADAAEPRHALVVDVMRLVVEDRELVDLADRSPRSVLLSVVLPEGRGPKGCRK